MNTIFEDDQILVEGPDAEGDIRIEVSNCGCWVDARAFLKACNAARVSFDKTMEKYDEESKTHESHSMRYSDSPYYDEICNKCNQADPNTHTNTELLKPCKGQNNEA
jgi:hypothetical protein